MKKIYYFIILCILTAIYSCSKEDDLKPTNVQYDYFTISPDATDAESVLRRKFYEDNNIHLLFNDTLCHEQRGTYADGTPYWFTEILALEYNITGTGNGARFTYIPQDINLKQNAVDFVENNVLPHLGDGLRPYSIFLVENLEYYEYSSWKKTSYYNGKRCLAIATEGVSDMTEEEIEKYTLDMFHAIVKSKIGSTYGNEDLTEFVAFGDPYYGEYFTDFGMAKYPEPEELYALGFLSWSGYSSYFPYSSSELTSFLKAIFYQDEDEFKTQYAEYPIILQKYDILKEVVKKKGYIF